MTVEQQMPAVDAEPGDRSYVLLGADSRAVVAYRSDEPGCSGGQWWVLDGADGGPRSWPDLLAGLPGGGSVARLYPGGQAVEQLVLPELVAAVARTMAAAADEREDSERRLREAGARAVYAVARELGLRFGARVPLLGESGRWGSEAAWADEVPASPVAPGRVDPAEDVPPPPVPPVAVTPAPVPPVVVTPSPAPRPAPAPAVPARQSTPPPAYVPPAPAARPVPRTADETPTQVLAAVPAAGAPERGTKVPEQLRGSGPLRWPRLEVAAPHAQAAQEDEGVPVWMSTTRNWWRQRFTARPVGRHRAGGDDGAAMGAAS